MNIKRNNKALTDTDINIIKNFKSKMSFSITLLFLPIFIIVGMLFESNKILIAYIVITGLGYIYSLYEVLEMINKVDEITKIKKLVESSK